MRLGLETDKSLHMHRVMNILPWENTPYPEEGRKPIAEPCGEAELADGSQNRGFQTQPSIAITWKSSKTTDAWVSWSQRF